MITSIIILLPSLYYKYLVGQIVCSDHTECPYISVGVGTFSICEGGGYSLVLLNHWCLAGGAEVCGFSTSLSDDEFSALLRKEGLKEPDCKKLSGMYMYVPMVYV